MIEVLLVMGLFFGMAEVVDHREEQKVIQALEQGIERFESKAAYALGYRYEIGDGVKQDFDKARSLYQQSANWGNVKGKYRWGYLLHPDNAPNANLEESIKIMKESLADLEGLWNETKDSESALYLGQMYYEEDDKIALDWFHKAEKGGDYRVYSSLGDLYSNRIEDDKLAKQWYKKALDPIRKMASDGVVYAQDTLGNMYYHGEGVKQDYKEANKWFRKAGDQGYSKAQYYLAWSYQHGQGVKQDDKEASKWFRKAAEQGDCYAQSRLGDMYFDGAGVKQDYNEALKWYLLSADQGCLNAVSMAGMMNYYGDGVEKNYKEALKWYQKGATSGDPYSQISLGLWYLYGGEGVDKNIAEAIKLLKQGRDYSSYELGLMNELGWGMKINIKKAIKLYQEDEDNFTLGMLYYSGDGLDKNEEKGISLMKESFNDEKDHAEHEGKDSQYALGFMYEHGIGVTKNKQTALKWYIKSTEGITPFFPSYLSIAKLYEHGVTLHGEDATKKAKEWYQRTYDKMIAEEKDMVYAQYVLGLLSEEGKGTDKDIKAAKGWYDKAAAGGSEKAKQRLIDLENNTR